jgi:zinc protease
MKPSIAKLKNNLTVVYYRQPRFSNVYLNLCFPVGSINEERSSAGINHLAEHLIWRHATSHFKKHSKNDYLADSLYGYSHKNHTDFEMVIPRGNVEESLSMFTQIVSNPSSFTAGDFKLEKEIVLEEILEEQSDNATQEYLADLEKTFYKNNPLSNRSLGDKRSVAKLDENLLRNYIEKTFVPSAAVLVIVGDLGNEKSVLSVLRKLDNSGGTLFRGSIPEVNFSEENVYLTDKKSPQNYFGLFFSFDKIVTIEESSKWFFVVKSLESFLFKQIRDKGYCYSLDVQSIVISGNTDLGIESSFDKKKTEGYYSALIGALRDFPGELEKNLASYKEREIFRLIVDVDDIYEQGRLLGWSYVNFGQVISIEEVLSVIKNIRAQNIKEYIEGHFSGKKGTLIVRGTLTKELKSKIRDIWSKPIS